MNKSEINEIRRRFNLEKNAITCIRGCYVNENREIVSMFNRSLNQMPTEEAEKYLAIFRRTLSGVQGKNLIDMVFAADRVMDGEEHKLLMALRNTALKVDEGVQTFCTRIIDSLEIEGNYLILMLHDSYDLPFRTHDENKTDVVSEEVFSYIACAVCPVKLTKPALSYFAEDNDFHDREPDWIVASPELGFVFPAFDDRTSNIYGALYYTRDAANMHDLFVDTILGTEKPMPAEAQKETFEALLEETLGDDLNYDVVQTVHEELRERMEEHKSNKESEAPTVTHAEVRQMLNQCGVSADHMDAFEERFEEEFGTAVSVGVANIVNEKKFEVCTPNVSIQVDPAHSDSIKTRVIDGVKYILIPADEGVMVNGLNISIHGEQA